MNGVPLLTVKLAKPGVELILNALAQLPYSQSAGLIREIETQANMQLEMMKIAATTAQNKPAEPEKPEIDPVLQRILEE